MNILTKESTLMHNDSYMSTIPQEIVTILNLDSKSYIKWVIKIATFKILKKTKVLKTSSKNSFRTTLPEDIIQVLELNKKDKITWTVNVENDIISVFISNKLQVCQSINPEIELMKYKN